LRSMKPLRRQKLARLSQEAGEGVRRPARRTARRPPTTAGAVRELSRSSGPLLRLTKANLYVDYRPVLRDLNWELRRGQHWAVFGANGAGKTSFLKLLYGDLSPALGGRIERKGFPAGTPIAAWKRQVGYVSPELQADYALDVSVLEVVASGRHASIGLADTLTAQDRRTALRWLKFFRLLSVAGRRPRELSYGQLRRVLLARALAGEPRILLLDEPLTGLDPRQRAVIKRLLERLMGRQLTAVIAVHHAEDLPRGMTHGLRLHRRRAYPADGHSANSVGGSAPRLEQHLGPLSV
jgi:molybdate transport system ATP-binding protein